MSVGTWGYGTGATTADAHPFSLTIQGIDVIEAVHIDTISVSQSVSSNATMTFTITDVAGTMAIPEGWADVVFTEHTGSVSQTGAFQADTFQADTFDFTEITYPDAPEVIFGGLVMGVNVRLGAPPIRYFDVRCVDYGVLLDVAPVMSTVTVGPSGNYLFLIVQQIAAAAPLGGITATTYYTDGRPGRVAVRIDETVLGELYTIPLPVGAVETVTVGQMARSALTTYAQRNEDPYDIVARPADVYVTPLRQLAVRPSDKTFGAAPLELRVNPTTASHIAGEISVDTDSRPLEAGVYVSDSDTTTGGDNSGWYLGTLNGYSVLPSSISRTLWSTDDRATEGRIYTEASGATEAGRALVDTTANFFVGTALTVYYPTLGLNGVYPIHAVTTRFLGGTENLRRSEIQFGGELGTVARFNRTRFARAGVTT